MVVKKRRKSSRMLGTNTYGWGKNKHRNSGSRGGFGNAGTGKKSHNKKTKVWAEDYFGKFGFVRHGQSNADVAINVRDVEGRLSGWVAQKQASREGDVFVVDLTKLGFTKLLGAGRVSTKMRIVIQNAVKSAKEKVQQAGGEVVVETK
ncbi:50S ribosomal protein L15 [Candidatus Woesearchaeota archaeon]|nr:MAG: 50S ribosomal protein L15 [Candidatus Woesearchaeota archaeon]